MLAEASCLPRSLFNGPSCRGYCHIPQCIWKEAAALRKCQRGDLFLTLSRHRMPCVCGSEWVCVCVCVWVWINQLPPVGISSPHCTVQYLKSGFTVWRPLLKCCFLSFLFFFFFYQYVDIMIYSDASFDLKRCLSLSYETWQLHKFYSEAIAFYTPEQGCPWGFMWPARCFWWK